MTKKDFEFIANAIIIARKTCQDGAYGNSILGVLEGILARKLSAEYPRFNKEKWFAYIDDGVQK